MTIRAALRRQLARLLTWSDAHISFDDTIAGLPAAARGRVPHGRAWSASVAGFKRDRRRLERLALDLRRDLLAPVPAGTGQTFLREVVLAADHTAYHVGQLVAVRRLLGYWATD